MGINIIIISTTKKRKKKKKILMKFSFQKHYYQHIYHSKMMF